MQPDVVACILAGGLSSRLGQDKARIRLGGRTLVGHIKQTATEAGLPVKVLRRDIVPRCGPIGGIYSALFAVDAEAIVFLACDMPFVSAALLGRLVTAYGRSSCPVFLECNGCRGFPCVIPKECIGVVSQQIKDKEWSIQRLSKVLKANVLRLGRRDRLELLNLNTEKDLVQARHLAKKLPHLKR